MKKHFLYYDEVSTGKLNRISKHLTTIDPKKLEQIAAQNFKNYFDKASINQPLKYTSKLSSVLNIPNSVLIFEFTEHPFQYTELEPINGRASIVDHYENDTLFSIPIVYLMPNQDKTTLKHEKIHICQYLLDSVNILPNNQKKLVITQDMPSAIQYMLEKHNNETANDFITNTCCYKLWIELEAYYNVSKEDTWWFGNAYRSSRPIMTFEAMHEIENLNWDVERSRKKFKAFCEIMEREVPWIKDFVSATGQNLYENIGLTHEMIECETLFGPIEDDDESDNFELYD